MPTSGLGLLVFLVAVAPGFYYELLRQRRFTRARESAFFEISRTLVASVAIGLVAGLAAFAVWLMVPQQEPPDITALLRSDPQYVGSHAGLMALCLLVYLGLSAAIAHLADVVLLKRRAGNLTTVHSLWHEVFRSRVPAGREPVARVALKSGAVWMGKVAKYSSEHEVADRELVLFRPIYQGTNTSSLELTHHDSVVLRGTEIESFSVDYVGTDPPQTA